MIKHGGTNIYLKRCLKCVDTDERNRMAQFAEIIKVRFEWCKELLDTVMAIIKRIKQEPLNVQLYSHCR